MSETQHFTDQEPVSFHPSEELIADPKTAWHALRGYDFAGLDQIMENGLKPANNQGQNVVCLSASPKVSVGDGREANSFYAYSLQDGISLGLNMNETLHPHGNHGGFLDEVRVPSVDAANISAVMVPESSVSAPLTELSTRHESRKPQQMADYLDRTVKHIEKLGGDPSLIDMSLLQVFSDSYTDGDYADRKAAAASLEAQVLAAYADVVKDKLGVPTPTVADVIGIILSSKRKRHEVQTVIYTEEQKRSIGLENAQIAARNRASDIGSFTMRADRELSHR